MTGDDAGWATCGFRSRGVLSVRRYRRRLCHDACRSEDCSMATSVRAYRRLKARRPLLEAVNIDFILIHYMMALTCGRFVIAICCSAFPQMAFRSSSHRPGREEYFAKPARPRPSRFIALDDILGFYRAIYADAVYVVAERLCQRLLH